MVKIYRLAHKTRGTIFQVVWRAIDGRRMKPQFAAEADAEKEAKLQASKLAKGQVEASELTAADRDELIAIRRICKDTPPLAALEEWAKAREICGGALIPAAETWAAANAKKFTPILAEKCPDAFIKDKGGAAKRTWGSLLYPIAEHFVGRHLHTITTPEWAQFFRRWTNGVTHNDARGAAVTMCRWAQRQGYIPRGIELEVQLVDKMPEDPPEIGIVLPETYFRLLDYLRRYHPHHLAAAVLAGVGMRVEEVHGKRADREKSKKPIPPGELPRQRWSDIHLGDMMLIVSNAKAGTPARRPIPLSDSVVEWLKLCPDQQGWVCEENAVERVRDIAKGLLGGRLPGNCFRHSYITFRLTTHPKAQVADWAGTSPQQIDKHYRALTVDERGDRIELSKSRSSPVTKKLAAAWFETTPEMAEKLPQLVQKTPAENGRTGGLVKSEAKTIAVTANAEKARAAKLGGVATASVEPIVEASAGELDDTGV